MESSIFSWRPQSLHLQILRGLVVALVCIVTVNTVVAYGNAREMAGFVTDHTLDSSARSIAEHIRINERGLEALIPPSALGMFASDYGDLVFYKVVGPDEELLAGYPDVPEPGVRPAEFAHVYYERLFRGQAVRFIALAHPIPGNNLTQQTLIIVGQGLKARGAMTLQMMTVNLLQQLLLVVSAMIIIWLFTSLSLKPLLSLGQAVNQREPYDFRPFPEQAVQTELRPFVLALNQYMERLRQQIAVQRRFIANAAHQFRTPLTLLRTQASFALREPTDDGKDDAIKAVLATTRQMTRLTNQLLMLSMAEPEGRAAPNEFVDMAELCRQVVMTCVDLALERNIDLGFEESPGGVIPIFGDRKKIYEMALNLLDNALRYTPVDGKVTVAVSMVHDQCILRVHDNGPGIPLSERQLVFERFYRILGSGAEGSGLGLAIVKEIVDSLHGAIALGEPEQGSGLIVEVRLQCTAETNSSV